MAFFVLPLVGPNSFGQVMRGCANKFAPTPYPNLLPAVSVHASGS